MLGNADGRMKRLTFFKVYGTEDPKLAEQRKCLLPNDTRYWSPVQANAFFDMRRLQPYQRAIFESRSPLVMDCGRQSGRRRRAMEVLVWQRLDYAHEVPPISDNRTANLAHELTGKEIGQCRHCGETPRKGLMFGLCFRCSGEKAINREI